MLMMTVRSDVTVGCVVSNRLNLIHWGWHFHYFSARTWKSKKKNTKQKFVLAKWFEIWSDRSVLVQRHLSCDNCKTWQDYLYSFSALKSIFGSGGKNACKTYSNFYSTIAKCIGVLGKAGSSINLFRIFFATKETIGKQRRLAACQQLCFLTFHFRVCMANTDWLVVNVEKNRA